MKTILSPEDEFNQIIDSIELRAMAADGPVIPTLQEATEAELSRLWELVNEISPKRKALARKIQKDNATDEETKEFLRQNGEDAEEIGRQGKKFVEVLIKKINMEKLFREVVMRYGLAFPENAEDLKWSEEGIGKSDPYKVFPRIVEMLKLGGETID